MARITVQHLADHLGLSKFAVSRALTGKPGVSDATRRRVVEAATAFGYELKPKLKRSANAIEILYHDPDTANRELWVAVQAGAQEEADRLGFSTAVRWKADAAAVAQLRAGGLGFILVGPHEPSVLAAVEASGLPCVGVGPALPPLDRSDHIASADREGAAAIADYLLGLGHRRFVYAEGKPGYPGRVGRQQVFAERVAAQPGAALRQLASRDDAASDDFRDALLAMADDGFEPTAIFCGNDGVAVTVMSELMRMGLRVPDDISVFGYADYPVASQIVPRLTTMRVPYRDMGRAAVRLLLARLGRFGPVNDLPPFRLALATELVERQSCAPPPARSWLPRLRDAPGVRPTRAKSPRTP